MRISNRGRFRTFVQDDGSPIVASIDAEIASAPSVRNGKTYMRVSVSDPIFQTIDAEIRRAQPDLGFAPLVQNKLFVKLAVGSHLVDATLREGDRAHLDLRLGTFGAFGYCWIASTAYKLE